MMSAKRHGANGNYIPFPNNVKPMDRQIFESPYNGIVREAIPSYSLDGAGDAELKH